MNRDQFAGLCRQLRGSLGSCWGRLTGNPLVADAGRHELLAGRMQVRYGVSREATARQLRALRRRLHVFKRVPVREATPIRTSKLYLIRS